MAPVSDKLSSSLAALHRQIATAESLLAKMPGAAKAYVSTEEILGAGVDTYLATTRNAGGDLQIVVEYCNDYGDAERTKPLSEYAVSTRVELCKLIPELIEEAVAKEGEVTEEIDEVAAQIEQAISTARS